MKVQTKITLLIVLVVAFFMVGLWRLRVYDASKFRSITQDRVTERNQAFDAFLEKHGEPLKMLAEDNANLDQMVQAIENKDQQWFSDNVNGAALVGYKANQAWIYGPDATLRYSTDTNYKEPPPLPIPPEALEQLFAKEPFAHFFVKIGADIVEIRGARVHGSRDFERPPPGQGFLFAGRLWNKPALEEMSLFSGTKLMLTTDTEKAQNISSDEENGLIVFSRPLNRWDGKPLAHLIVRNEMPAIEALNHWSKRFTLLLFAFALVLLLLIYASLVRWVSRPLRHIMESLKRDDPKPIEGISRDNSEFGELARTTRKFFEQRDNLIREMEERRAAKEALRKSEEELRHSQKMEAVGPARRRGGA